MRKNHRTEKKRTHVDPKPLGLMFHYFHDGDKHPRAQGTISPVQFDQVINQVMGNARVLQAEEWTYKADNHKLASGDVCLTFDDALKCQVDVALPILRRAGLTAFWFVQSGILTGDVGLLEVFRRFRNEYFPSMSDFYECFISRTLATTSADIRSRITAGFPTNYLGDFQFYTREDRLFRYIRDEVLQPEEYVEIMQDLMRTMNTNAEKMSQNLFLDKDWLRALEKDGHVIGLHSHSHPTCMADLPREKQRLEYETNYEVLSDILMEPPYAVAHPCNSYSAGTLRILRDLGIRIGFRSNTAKLKLSSLEFPRRDSADLLIDLAV